jgi:hypothetical protein
MANTHTQKETTTYSDMIRKEELGPMLNLDPSGPWEIVSETETGLVMIHYRQDADLETYGALRGVVLDTNVGKIVSCSYPNAPKIVTSSLSVTDGKILLNEQISLNPEKIRLNMGFEGTLIHIFKHGGQVYRSTRKRFDSSKSRWGNGKTFGEIYTELSGPEDNVLFDPTKDYSPYVHTFIMVHPDLLICTKDNIGSGFLVYLGAKRMYSDEQENCPYSIEKVDIELHVPNVVSSFENESSEKRILSPPVLSLEEANKHLLFGFYEGFEGYQYLDNRLLPGEFVILEDTETGMMYRIESPAYAWRCEIRNNNPNLLHRFFELLDYSYLKETHEDIMKYQNMFPFLTPYSVENLKTVLPIVVWPQKEEVVPVGKENKLHNIWQNFLVAMPLSKQNEIIEFHDHLKNKREEVVSWLTELSEKKVEVTEFSKRVQDILNKTKKFALDKIKKGNNIDLKTRKVKNLETLVQENIKNFISKERGSSLYRIIREMDKNKNPIE